MRNVESQLTPEQQAEPWIPDGLQEALDSDVIPTTDDLFGPGERHIFGQIGEASLRLFPNHQTVELDTLEAYLVLKKPSRLTIARDGVYIETPGETQTSFLDINRDGGFTHVSKPRQLELDRLVGGSSASERPAPVDDPVLTTSNEPITEAPIEALVSEVTAPWEVEGSDGSVSTQSASDLANQAAVRDRKQREQLTDTLHRSSEPDDRELNGGEAGSSSEVKVLGPSVEPAKVKKPRVDFNGRVGRLPTFKTTKNGKRKGTFPVAEHIKDAEGETITNWYTVMAFNAIAERLEAQIKAAELAVGDEIRVAGYRQQTHVPDGKGGLKETEVIFAAHVGKAKQKGAEDGKRN